MVAGREIADRHGPARPIGQIFQDQLAVISVLWATAGVGIPGDEAPGYAGMFPVSEEDLPVVLAPQFGDDRAVP